ncbi:type IV pilus secretin PilQ [Ignatzschineria sp. LJL83]
MERNTADLSNPLPNSSVVSYEIDDSLRQSLISSSSNGKMSFAFHDVSLTYLMKLLAFESGQNIMVHPSVEQKLTLTLSDKSFEEVLDLVLLYTGLHKMIHHDVIFITNEKEFHRMDKGDLVTEVVALDYAEAEELLSMLEKHRFDGGIERTYQSSIGADQRLNQLVITDQRAEVMKLKQVIRQLDQPAKQVEISAYIVAAFDDFAKELGVNWGLSYQSGSQNVGGNISSDQAGAGNLGSLGSLTSLGVLRPNFSMAYMILGKGLNLGLELSAMQSGGRGEIISNPTVLTTSRKSAYIKQGSEVAYSTSSNDGTNTQFKEAVMELNVTPQITPDNKIMMDIFISKDEIAGYTANGEPMIAKKELSTQAIVSHGETIILGGIYEYENIEGSQEVPFLSQLPFIGALFKKETTQRRKAELLIFIRPQIVDTLIR